VYTEFSIRNFRCFRDFAIKPLERVNLIAGKNNVGKTALLEAMFIFLGAKNPSLPTTVNLIRGIDQYKMDADDLWGWLFCRKNTGESIDLVGICADGTQRRLELSLRPGEGEPSPLPSLGTASTGTSVSPSLVLEYSEPGGAMTCSRASVTSDGKLKIDGMTVAGVPPGIYLSSRAHQADENPQRYSELEKTGRQGELLEVVQLIEPRLRRLALLLTGGKPLINGDIGLGELVPVPLMGEGIGRLLTIVLAILTAPKGVVLIDEVENGFHHSVMVDVWRTIAGAARRSDTQVIASTHSWECISAAHEAFENGETYDFCLHRLERLNGEIKSIAYDRESLSAALRTELEVR